MREKLIELLEGADQRCNRMDCDDCLYVDERMCVRKLQVDYLIANGVTVRANGRWVVENEASIRCSECCFNRVSIKMPMDYCPICGAHMGW